MRTWISLIVVAIGATASVAQEMKPPKEVGDLNWMVGKWSGKGNISFGGKETPISSTMSIAFDGQFLRVESVDDSAGFKMTKTSMTGWDGTKKQYISYTFTNISPQARIAHGKLSQKELVMVSDEWEAEGMKAVARETTTKLSDSRMGLKMEFKIGDKWMTGMDFTLEKK